MTEEVLRWIQKENLIQAGDTVLVGLSGGADSVCLLRVLAVLREKIGFSLQAVHVEHGIRGGESREDAMFAERLCEKMGLSCKTWHLDVPLYAKEQGIGLEEAARLLRYDCYRKAAEEELKKGCAEAKIKIALAHHADDQAETVLFQMARGSGIHGLCGIRPKRALTDQAEIIRPLLSVTRREIEDYLKELGQEFRVDSTNWDTDYSRNRIRHKILPQLEQINSQAACHIAQSAENLSEIAEYLDKEVKALLPAVCRKEEEGYLILDALFQEYPTVLQKEAVLSVLGEVSGSRKDIGMVHVESVRSLAALQVGRQMTLPYGVCATRVYDGICLQRTVTEKTETLEYEIDREGLLRAECGESLTVTLPDGELLLRIFDFSGEIGEIPKKKYTKWMDYDKIKDRLRIRTRAAGDYLVIDTQGHRKKLKQYFVEEKIPANVRNKVWLLADASHILWVIGGRISADCRIQKSTRRILEIQITGGNYYED